MSNAAPLPAMQDANGNFMFTCISCSIAFASAEDQRTHYRSDHHRYNMKRRVASLPPVSAAVFNQRVLERKAETAIQPSLKDSTCTLCNKVYTTENAYKSHINSKKHKDNQVKTAVKILSAAAGASSADQTSLSRTNAVQETQQNLEKLKISSKNAPTLRAEEDASEEQIYQTIDQKIAAARSRLSAKDCLFCTEAASSLDDNIVHMSSTHSFFIPELDYLVDIEGLILYLGEKIAVGNVCIYCNGKGREFRTMEAVRKHMLDKSHCKIAYDTERDRLELSKFYDFSSSYPDADSHRTNGRNRTRRAEEAGTNEEHEEEWEDTDDDNMDADEVVEEESDTEDSDDAVLENQLTYGDSPYELVLPSGARIGHRSLKRYYDQTFTRTPRGTGSIDPNSGAAIVRKLLGDKNSQLVPTKGGFGAFGAGTQVVKARNRGEAREAGRHVREFRDQKRKEDYKTRVAFVHNHQKHFRDPLLQ